MRQAIVRVNGRTAGLLTEYIDKTFEFKYQEDYFADQTTVAVSLSLPKSHKIYRSPYLFPCFCNLLSEGANKALQCQLHKIDPDDEFGLLLATAQYDCIGALTFESVTL